MAKGKHAGDEYAQRGIVTTRIINAGRELVFKLWTEAEHVAQWWGPNGFTNTIQEMDVRPGGVMKFVMHGPDGTDYPNLITYLEVVRPERLVFTHGSGPADPHEFHNTVTFDEKGGKTRITMRALFGSAADRDMVVKKFGAIEGARQTLQRLEGYILAKKIKQ